MTVPLHSSSTRADITGPTVFLLILGLLCLRIAAGMSTTHGSTLAEVGLVGIAVATLAERNPLAAIAGLLLTVGFMREDVGTGTGNSIVAALVVALDRMSYAPSAEAA